MRKKLTSLSLLAFIGLSAIAFGQVKGTVNDVHGFASADTEVTVKGTSKVAYTDENGNFDIDAKIGDTLIIDGKEYIVSKNDLGVLKPSKSDIVDLDETVVTAYGTQKRENVVGSNTQIKSEKFEDRPLTNIGKALEGASSGVQFSTSSGQPGESTNIRIRGFSSYNLSNSPLYVVDGAIFTGSLSDLNPSDIESINILKDAASTSLYGASAANGVVMVTTKKGKKGKGNFTFTSNTGVVTRAYKDYEKLGPEDYYKLTWTSMRNGYWESNPTLTEQQANDWASKNLITTNLKNNIYNVPNDQVIINGQLNPLAKQLYNDFDWVDYVSRVGSIEQYNMSFSGADDKSNYYASIGYNNEKGYVIKSDFERYTARVNGSSKVTNWLRVGGDISGTLTKSKLAESAGNTSYINPFYTARYMGPIYSPYLYDDKGQRVYDQFGNIQYDGLYTRGRGAGASGGRNVLQETLLNDKYEKTNSVFSRWFAELTLAKGLTLSGNLSYDLQNYYYQSYQNKVIGDGAGKGTLANQNQQTVGMTINQILNYKKSFGKHNFEVLVGHESFIRNSKYNYQSKEGEVIPNIYELVNFTTSTSNNGYKWDLSKESYFGRVNYDFNNIYSVSASIRQDESSRFAPGQNKGVFWSAGAAWNISREAFLVNSTVVNSLKLRTSYGEVGNDGGLGASPGYQADLSLYSLGTNNGGEPGVFLSQIGNPLLTWEANKQFDVGVDFALFNNRVSGSVEYYDRRTDDMIFSVPTPGSAGVPGNSIDRNIGTVQNSGIEVTLNLGIIRTDEFKWDFSVNASTIKNEMVKMPGDQKEIINGTKKISVGKSMYDYWLRKFYAVDPDTGRSLYYQDPNKKDDLSTKTINGQKFTINHVNAEFDYVGTAIPDLYGSFTNNIEYKRFYLNTLFTYQIGGQTYDGNYTSFLSLAPTGAALHKDMLNAWTKPGDVTSVNKLSTNNTTQNMAASSRWLVDSDYLSLRNVTFGYNFEKAVIEKLGLTNLKLYISGENIVAWTKKQGLEPVQSFNGTTTYRYTPSRTVSVGLNVQF